jgi:hypothetical protein
MWVFRMIVKVPAAFLAGSVANAPHRRTVWTKPVRHDSLWLAVMFHRTLQEIQRSLAITAFRDKDLKSLAFLVDGPPKIMCLCVYPNEHFIEATAPVWKWPAADPVFFDLPSEHRAEPAPLEPNGLVADG